MTATVVPVGAAGLNDSARSEHPMSVRPSRSAYPPHEPAEEEGPRHPAHGERSSDALTDSASAHGGLATTRNGRRGRRAAAMSAPTTVTRSSAKRSRSIATPAG